ncbi:MAG: hypothetical protein Q8O03_02280 [Nanoarchaeota archaeon]|nr:hypothetical protein [Nanoarchaeota archaeon]
MIEDKIEEKMKLVDANKNNVKSLAKIVKKAMSLTDRMALKVNDYYNDKEYGLIVTVRTWVAMGATDPHLTLTSAFRIEPVTDTNGALRGISVYASVPKEKENSYSLAKEFAKKFEAKYPGQYKIEIKTTD